MNKTILFLTILLLSIQTVYAQQDISKTITDILIDFSGVIFIIIFVLLLLAIGGVFQKIRIGVGGIPWGSILLLIFIALLFIIPQFIPYPVNLSVPENFKAVALPAPAVNVLMMLGLPREWVAYVPAVIYLFLLPFAAIFTLVWAFLSSLSIFTNVSSNVNRILAFIIAFMTIPVGWYVKIVWILFSFMGAYSVAAFAAIFIIGVLFRGYGTVAGEYYKVQSKKWRETAINHLRNALADIKNKRGGDAANLIDTALKIQGFSPNYYNKLTEAKTALSASPPDYKKAESNVEDALKELS